MTGHVKIILNIVAATMQQNQNNLILLQYCRTIFYVTSSKILFETTKGYLYFFLLFAIKQVTLELDIFLIIVKWSYKLIYFDYCLKSMKIFK